MSGSRSFFIGGWSWVCIVIFIWPGLVAFRCIPSRLSFAVLSISHALSWAFLFIDFTTRGQRYIIIIIIARRNFYGFFFVSSFSSSSSFRLPFSAITYDGRTFRATLRRGMLFIIGRFVIIWHYLHGSITCSRLLLFCVNPFFLRFSHGFLCLL